MGRDSGQGAERGAGARIFDDARYAADAVLRIDGCSDPRLRRLRVIEGSLTLGGLVAFQSLMASFTGPVTDLINLAEVSKRSGAGSCGWKTSTIILWAIPRPTVTRRFPPKLTGRIELKHTIRLFNDGAAPAGWPFARSSAGCASLSSAAPAAASRRSDT